MEPTQAVRLDKWLWAVRLYRSRSLAVQACQAGHVKIGGRRVKPARDVRVGEIITAQTGRLSRVVRVRGLVERRVGARHVPEFLDELTPEENRQEARRKREAPSVHFPRGLGRPTKKQRRQLEGLL